MKIVGNSVFQRAANISLILNFLRTRKNASRGEIAEKLGLRPSTVTYITGRLINGGILRTSAAESRRKSKRIGRRPVQLEIVPDFGQVIGMDIQADYYHGVVTDIRGEPVIERRRELPVDAHSIEERLKSAVEDLSRETDLNTPVLGMGIAIPGIVNASSRIIKDCWTHKLIDHDLSWFLDDAFPFPVLIENDANCCARHVQWREEGLEKGSFIYLLTKFHEKKYLPESVPPMGIGLGLILGGRLYSGAHHEAGEYQSVFYRSEEAVHWQLSMDNERIEQAGTDPGIQREIVSEILGNVLFLMKILNPEALYIGGEAGAWGAMIQESLEEEYAAVWKTLQRRGCRIHVLEESDSHPAMGAAACMLDSVYTIPQVGGGAPDKRIWDGLLANLFKDGNYG